MPKWFIDFTDKYRYMPYLFTMPMLRDQPMKKRREIIGLTALFACQSAKREMTGRITVEMYALH